MDLYYPVKEVASGGALGNSIFFFLSAFGLYLSAGSERDSFGTWMSKRVSRIYPSLWILLIIVTLPLKLTAGQLHEAEIVTFIGGFLDPPYLFLQTLLLYYVISYHLFDDRRQRELNVLFCTLACLYFLLYFSWIDLTKWSIEKSPFDQIHYLIIFLFGIAIARKQHSIFYSGPHDYLIPIMLIALIYTHKYFMTKNLFSELQFLQQAAIYPTVYYLIKVSRSPLVGYLLQNKTVGIIVAFLSRHTLEIYLVHEAINNQFAKLHVPFPLNLIAFIAITLILSAAINRIADVIRKSVN